MSSRYQRLKWCVNSWRMGYTNQVRLEREIRMGRRPLSFMFALTIAVLTAMPGRAQVIRSGPASCPGVALTFDLCPVRVGSGYDQALIEYLIEHHIPATFFMSGRWIKKHDEQVRILLQIPFFEIGTHGEVHAHLPMVSPNEQKQEILGPVRFLKTTYGHEASLFRPPYGEFTEETVGVAKRLGLQFILWNVVSGDPDPTLSVEQIENSLARRIRNGSIIVMHANGKGQYTREAVTRLYERLLPARHLRPMTVSEILSCQSATP
jgi:peptidoglycan/xylan/chitin deacetylase (PgdA/CDA1 family)